MQCGTVSENVIVMPVPYVLNAVTESDDHQLALAGLTGVQACAQKATPYIDFSWPRAHSPFQLRSSSFVCCLMLMCNLHIFTMF